MLDLLLTSSESQLYKMSRGQRLEMKTQVSGFKMKDEGYSISLAGEVSNLLRQTLHHVNTPVNLFQLLYMKANICSESSNTRPNSTKQETSELAAASRLSSLWRRSRILNMLLVHVNPLGTVNVQPTANL